MQEMPDEIASRMRTVIGRMSRGLRRTHAGTELSPSQYDVLATIGFRGPVRLSDLAAIESINPTLLSRIVGKLEERELVCREPFRSGPLDELFDRAISRAADPDAVLPTRIANRVTAALRRVFGAADSLIRF